MKIPFMNLKSQFLSIENELRIAIDSVLHDCNFILGPHVEEFEKNFASYCQANFCIGVGNGTDAIVIALQAIGIEPGDTVITVCNTFIATSEAISKAGGKVAFVDVESTSCLMDPLELENKILTLKAQGERVRAIVPVHLYGQPCDMPKIIEIAKKHELMVLEDCAQAHGAEINGKRVGSWGDVSTFSFYPGKNLGAFGDAGAIVTSSKMIAEKAFMLRNHGRYLKKYEHEMEGYNSRLDGLQGAILNVKLRHLESWTEKRIQNAALYMKLLSGISEIILPTPNVGVRHVFHLFVIRVKNRNIVQEYLEKNGVSTGIHYPIPLHLQPAYSSLGLKRGSFKVAEKISDEILSLPMDAELSAEKIEYICSVLKKCIS